jgi:hypothetical protein
MRVKIHILFLAVFIISAKVDSQWLYLPVVSDTYGTGYISGIGGWIYDTKNTGDIYAGEALFSSYDYLGWAMFDITSIPEDAVISSVAVIFSVKNNSSSSKFTLCLNRLNIDPRWKSVSAYDIANSFYQSGNYLCELIGTEKTEVNIYLHDTEAISDLQKAVENNDEWWGLFLYENGYNDKRVIFNGNNANEERKPRLAILYTKPCKVPTGLTVLNLGETSARLDWDDVSEAEGYEVAIRQSGSSWNYYSVENSYYDVSGLECGSNYEYNVRANCGNNNYSEFSDVCNFTTSECPCNMPGGLAVTNIGQNGARLDWAEVSGALGYEIGFRHRDSAWMYLSVESSYYDVSGLECEEDYEFIVRSYCGGTNYSPFTSAYEFTTHACPCYVPEGLNAFNLGETSASLDWEDVTGAVDYEVGIRLAGESWNYFTVGSSYYNVLGLQCNKNYEFIVRSHCGSSNYSEYSGAYIFKTDTCPCNIPAGITIKELDQTYVGIAWANISGAVGYEAAMRKTGQSWNYFTLDTNYFQASGLECDEDYEFTVRTYCGDGNYSSFTTVYDFTTMVCPCLTPSDLSVSNEGQTSATLNWSNVSGAEGYEVAIREESASWNYLTVGSSFYNVLGLECDHHYEFAVRTNCGSGNYSAYSDPYQFSAAICPCEMPQDLTIMNLDVTSATISWSSIPDADYYELAIRKKDSLWVVYTTTSNTYNMFELDCNTTYEFAVRTKCTRGNYSPFTAIQSFTTESCPCYFPNNLSYKNLSSNSIVLNWQDIPGSLGYEVRYKPVTGSAWIYESTESSTLSTNYLDCGTTYTWQVSTYCGINNYSIWVSDSEFTTDPCSCSSPENLSAGFQTTNSALLEWSTVPGANSYEIRIKPTSSSTWIYNTSSTNSNTISGLECEINYEWQVRAACSNGGYSQWVTGNEFTTGLCSCTNPSGLTAISTGQNSVDLDWSTVPDNVGYEVRFKPKFNTEWSVTWQILSKSNYSVTNLTCGNTYSWEVRVNCGEGNFSDWIKGDDFNTYDCPCELPQKPEFITKEVHPVIQNSYLYEVQALPGINEYIWNITGGIPSMDFSSVNILWNSLGSQEIVVKSVNICGESDEEILTVDVLESPSFSDDISNFEWIIFPNPSSGILYIRPVYSKESTCRIQVIDFTGRIVYDKMMMIYEADQIITLDISEFRYGIYLIRIEDSDHIYTEKIIKN